jgi:gamma-glutamyl-gamma-aminobutyrate hydrolase PuuD
MLVKKEEQLLIPYIPGKLKVFVQGTVLYQATCQMWRHKGYPLVDNLMDADIICYTGGEDISPALYKERKLEYTYPNIFRDNQDRQCYHNTVGNAYQVGLCRGGQLLNVLNDGRLWQDVDGHHFGTHPVYDVKTNVWKNVNTLHHQGIRPTIDATILTWAQVSSTKIADKETWSRGDIKIPHKSNSDSVVNVNEVDIEACWYEKTGSLCVQWHPEFSHAESTNYFFELLEDCLHYEKV